MGIEFEWDQDKAAHNLQKHGVSFQEAATVFADTLNATVLDPDHSVDEDRYITVGLSCNHRLLMVSHTEHSARVRIISSRELTRKERKQYEEGG